MAEGGRMTDGGEMTDSKRVTGSCHCGRVTLSVPHAPLWVASCNCSLCTKTGWLVAYYPDAQVEVTGETMAYIWGDKMIGIHHCPVCGCGTHWQTLGEDFGKMGVHARLLDGFDAGEVGGFPSKCNFDGVPVEVRFMDNRGSG